MAYVATSFSFGEQPSAAKWNQFGTNDAYFDSLIGSGTAWTSWTPTFVNFTKGSATITAKYQQFGKTVIFRLEVTLSTSTMGTSPTFTLPVTATTYNTNTLLNSITILDSGTTTFFGYWGIASSTTGKFLYWDASVAAQSVTVNTPMVWANNDGFFINGIYEAA